jgi:hypothetical protein
MFGDCQGNLCAVDVAGLLAAERGVPVTAIEKGQAGSWLFASGRGAATAAGRVPVPLATEEPVDLVVVGLGAAGAAARVATMAAGLRVVGLDRQDGWTATGLLPDRDGWLVEAQGEHGMASVPTRAVLVATGGSVVPREERDIPGPRPSGVITSDLVTAALAAGLLPGRTAVVVGGGALAARTVAVLEAAGVRCLANLAEPPMELRGTARLEAVRTPSGWIDADTLVLADRLQPQAFLLRPLGLVDGRPGTTAPADADGRLELPGLWAVGCCVDPDAEHRRCAERGSDVGQAIAASLREVLA